MSLWLTEGIKLSSVWLVKELNSYRDLATFNAEQFRVILKFLLVLQFAIIKWHIWIFFIIKVAKQCIKTLKLEWFKMKALRNEKIIKKNLYDCHFNWASHYSSWFFTQLFQFEIGFNSKNLTFQCTGLLKVQVVNCLNYWG